ncbi:MAG: LacI family transcriptional regulator [Planctomycetes bacterium]|jgi:LacI family transcriptional regulator|nr:LacI family transcriptional regulator [Planctomycetota bacterium]
MSYLNTQSDSRTTLRDVAQAVGLSEITVSRALRGMASVNEQTRRRILAVANKKGYCVAQGLAMPRGLRGAGKSQMHRLRLIMPVFGEEEVLSSDFSVLFIEGLRERLDQLGGSLSIVEVHSVGDLHKCTRGIRFHGFVLRQLLPVAWVEQLARMGPVVTAGSADLYEGVSSISHNERRAASSIATYLARLGHKRILWLGVLGGQNRHRPLKDAMNSNRTEDIEALTVANHGARYAAWHELSLCNRPASQSEQEYFNCIEDSSEKVLNMILRRKNKPSALVLPETASAHNIIRNLRDKGYRVPEDFSVVAYGLKSQAGRANTELAIMDLPMKRMGDLVPELISRQLADPSALPISIQLEATLHKGNTVMEVKEQ